MRFPIVRHVPGFWQLPTGHRVRAGDVTPVADAADDGRLVPVSDAWIGRPVGKRQVVLRAERRRDCG